MTFFSAVLSGNEAIYEKLRMDTTPLASSPELLLINKSPWSNLDGFKAFLP